MAKQKTHKGLKKRIRISASGKLKHKRCCGGHLMSGKNAKRRRRIAGAGILDKTVAKKVKAAMGA